MPETKVDRIRAHKANSMLPHSDRVVLKITNQKSQWFWLYIAGFDFILPSQFQSWFMDWCQDNLAVSWEETTENRWVFVKE